MDWCYMCKWHGKSMDHLLLHCDVVQAPWEDIFALLDFAWVMPKRVVDLLVCWCGIRENRLIANVWKMMPLCLYGAFGMRGTEDVLIKINVLWKELEIYFSELCYFWSSLLC